MSQHDFNIANQGFPSFRTDLNNALVALATTSSGTAEPSTTFANQLWYETDTNILHIRNEANSAWLDLMVIDQTTGSPSFTAGNVGVGTSSPSYNLDVQGTGAQASVRIKNTSTGGGDPDANLYLDTGNSSGESAVYFQQGGANAGNVSFVGSDLRLYSDIGGVGFYTGATNRMFVSGAGNVGIGTTSPTVNLDIYDDTSSALTVRGDTTTYMRLERSSADVSPANIFFTKSRGTQAAKTAAASGDATGIVSFQAFGGTNNRTTSAIRGYLDAYVSDTNLSGSLRFYTTNASSTESEVMRITPAGDVGIGPATNPGRKLHVLHEDATTNTVVPAVRVARSTTGTPATGIGAGIDFLVETAASVGKIGSVFEIVSTDITPSSEDFDFVLKLMAGGAAAAEVMRVDSGGTISNPLGTSMAAAFFCARADSTALNNFLVGYRSGIGSQTGNPVALRTAGDAAGNVAALTFEIGGAIGSSEKMRLTSAGNLALGTTSPVVQLQTSSDALVGGVVYCRQGTPTSFAAAATATIADLLLGIVRYTGAAATVTLPTGTDIEGGVPATFPNNHSFDFSVINTGSGTVTLGTATGLTLIGGMTVAAGVSGMFRVRKTGTNAYTVYRLS